MIRAALAITVLFTITGSIFVYQKRLEESECLYGYSRVLKGLKNRGFEFWSFKKFFRFKAKMGEDFRVDALPERLILFRLDIHHRDIRPGYIAFEENLKILGEDHGTYFVMWGHPFETRTKEFKETHSELVNDALISGDRFRREAEQKDYSDFIRFIGDRGEEVQPHVSPVAMAISKLNLSYREKFDSAEARVIRENYYDLKKAKDGKVKIILKKGQDPQDFVPILKALPRLLKDYNNAWESRFGVSVGGYAAHGEGVFRNKVVSNDQLLRDSRLANGDYFNYEAYQPIQGLEVILSDGKYRKWFDDPDLIKPGRYRLLLHPWVWEQRSQGCKTR